MTELPGWYAFDAMGIDRPLGASDHDIQVTRYCEQLYEESRDDLEKHEELVNLEKYINYLMGKQWTERRPSYKASPVSNRVWANLIQLTSYLTDVRLAFDIRATNRLYDGHAKLLNKMARAWFFNEDVDMSMAMIIMHAALTIGYGRLIWNRDLRGGEGEMELIPLGPLDVIPIRPGHHLQRSVGVIYRSPKPLSWFREKYPDIGWKVPKDASYSRFTAQAQSTGTNFWGKAVQTISPQFRRLFGATAANALTKDSVIPMAVYREFWLRDPQVNQSNVDVWVGNPDKEYGYKVKPGEKLYPRGRLIIMGGPILLYDGPNPFWHGQFPFAALRLNRVPWQWPGVSEFRNQLPLQDVMNNTLAGILDAVKRAVNPPLLAPDNAFGASVKRNLDPNMPNAKVFYSPASIAAPFYAQSPTLPGFVFQTLLYAQGELDAQTGFIDLQAAARRNVIPAADTLEQLKEGQQVMVRLKVRHIEQFMKDIGSQWIPNAFQFYSLGRRVASYGKDGYTFEDFDWNPATMIPAQSSAEAHFKRFVWMIQPGSLLKASRVPQQQIMLMLRKLGAMDLKNLFESLDLIDIYESVMKGLREEGKDFLLQAAIAKQAQGGGPQGVTPGGPMGAGLIKQLAAPGENPEPQAQ